MFRKCEEKKNVQVADFFELAAALLRDLGAFTTHNGDRSTNYFVLAKDEIAGTDVSVSLIEERAGLPRNEWGYSLHVVDNITPSDCAIYHDAGLPAGPEILVKAMLEITLADFLAK